VFRQAKLVGWLSQEESLGLAWISDAISHTVVTFPCDGTTYDQQLSSFFVEKGSTKLIPSLSNGKLEITVDVKAKGVLEESACKLNLQDPKVLTKLEHSIQDEIKKEIEVAFKGAKRLKTDVLGFGNAFHTEYPNAWKEMKDNWGESFMDIKMNVKVEANIRRTGIINNSVSKILK
jgi:spore germination protein KC